MDHHRDDLGETHFDGKLLFAGEHTALWVGYVHGAYAEGERAAQEIMGQSKNGAAAAAEILPS